MTNNTKPDQAPEPADSGIGDGGFVSLDDFFAGGTTMDTNVLIPLLQELATKDLVGGENIQDHPCHLAIVKIQSLYTERQIIEKIMACDELAVFKGVVVGDGSYVDWRNVTTVEVLSALEENT